MALIIAHVYPKITCRVLQSCLKSILHFPRNLPMDCGLSELTLYKFSEGCVGLIVQNDDHHHLTEK